MTEHFEYFHDAAFRRMMIVLLAFCLIVPLFPLRAQEKVSQSAVSGRAQKLMDALGCTVDETGLVHLDCAVINPKTKIISFPAEINIVGDPIEVLVSTAKGRTHESLFVTELDPFKLHLALILADYHNGAMMADASVPQGALFDVMVKVQDGREVKADSWLYCEAQKGKKYDGGYAFVGSEFINNRCIASALGNLININSSDSDTIINAVMTSENIYLEYVSVKELVPPRGTEVTIVLVPRASNSAEAKRDALNASAPLRKMTSEELEAIRNLFTSVKFTGNSVFLDYDKMVSALSVRIPPNYPAAAHEIIAGKLKLVNEFLALYDKEYMMNPYIRISEVKTMLQEFDKLYEK